MEVSAFICYKKAGFLSGPETKIVKKSCIYTHILNLLKINYGIIF